MAYHEATWVVAGTAEPVIALAHSITYGRSGSIIRKIKRLKSGPPKRWLGYMYYGLAALSFFGLGYAFVATLITLDGEAVSSLNAWAVPAAIVFSIIVLPFNATIDSAVDDRIQEQDAQEAAAVQARIAEALLAIRDGWPPARATPPQHIRASQGLGTGQ